MDYYKNKVVWLTGASSGIGKELLKQLAQQGARVIASARRRELLIQIGEDLLLNDSNFFVLDFDLNSFDPDIIADKAIKAFGRVDILINNGGISQKSTALDTIDKVDRQIMEVNYFANVMISKRIAAHMCQNNSGHIVTIASILGKFGLPLLATYAASKHALFGWYNSLRFELQSKGVNITIVSPGFINTDVTLNSVTADGNKFNQNSVAQEKGMPASKCATKILKGVSKNKWHFYVGRIETFMPHFQMLFPKLFTIIINKLSKG